MGIGPGTLARHLVAVAIGSMLLAAVAVAPLHTYAGAHLLGTVGILDGPLSSSVLGVARHLHESMTRFAIGAWIPLATETRSACKSRASSPSRTGRELVTALQFFVGGLVTFGGFAYARGASYPVGTALVLAHLMVGLTGLFAGYAFLRRKAYSGRFLIAINCVTIAYSALSEGVAQIYALMPPGIDDALIGTIIAIVVSFAIIYLLKSADRAGGASLDLAEKRGSRQWLGRRTEPGEPNTGMLPRE